MAHCCSCSIEPAPSCRQAITAADLATLLYVQGLDINLCTKFQTIASLMQLRDCAGNIIAANAQVVLCTEFTAELCDALTNLAAGGSLILGTTQVVGADCLTYTVPETPLTVIDTTCINLTASGPFAHTLQADLVISPNAGNTAQCLVNGLFVPPGADICDELAILPYNGVAVPGVTKIVANDCNVYDLPPAAGATIVQVADTTCLDLNVIQAPVGTYTISGTPVVSPNADNSLSCLGNGLFVPDVSIAGQDTACIDIEIVEGPGNNDFVIMVDPIISGAVGNILECTPQGLFVPTAAVALSVVDTDCLDLTIVESPDNVFTLTGDVIVSPVVGNALACSPLGLFVLPGAPGDPVVITGIDTNCIDILVDNPVANQWNITVTPIIDPDLDNQLVCGVDGLFVPPGAATTVSVTDSSTVNLGVTQLGDNYDVTGAVIIAPTRTGFPGGCNPLVAQADGLSVPPDHMYLNFDQGSIGPPQSGPMTEGAIRIMTGLVVNITNPSACRSMAVSIITRIPEVHQEQFAAPSDRLRTRIGIDHDFAFPTATPPVVIPLTLKTQWWLASEAPEVGWVGAQLNSAGNQGGSIVNQIILPPGAGGTYQVTGTIEQLAGDAADIENNNLVVQVIGHTI